MSSSTRISGLTHSFYRYPAGFSPESVRELIKQFSNTGDYVLDPFMGGGTVIVEALALGRKAVGVDINSLAYFVSTVKSTPLSDRDISAIRAWFHSVAMRKPLKTQGFQKVIPRNLPVTIGKIFGTLLHATDSLPMLRQRRFVRCAILKTGQWAVDCQDRMRSGAEIVQKMGVIIEDMFEGLSELVRACAGAGTRKNKITSNRQLHCRSAIGMESARGFSESMPRLVVTSPPYPSVHILYHRWQIRGRRETPAPYWIAGLNDGHYESYYCFGSRSKLGLQNYFQSLRSAFQSVKSIIHPDAFVLQLVAFSHEKSQLPMYLEAMHEANFREHKISGDTRISREVPNRKWYSRILPEHDAAKEVLLVHKPM